MSLFYISLLLTTVLSVRRLKQPAFLEASSPPAEPAPRRQPIQLPRESEPAPVSPTSPPAAPAAAPAEEEEEEELYDDASVPAQRHEEPPAMSLMSQGLPRRPASDDEEEENQDWEGQLIVCIYVL